MRLASDRSGFAVETDSYRLRVDGDAWTAALADGAGRSWAGLSLIAAVDTLDGPDETDRLAGPVVTELDGRVRLTWQLGSTRWQAKRLQLECTNDALAIRTEVEGSGRVTDVSLLGGHAMLPDGATGTMASRPSFATLFSPAPSDPATVVLSPAVSTDISAAGGAEPGRGQWFFTPAPFCYAVCRSRAVDPLATPEDDWLTFGLVATPRDQSFVGFGYRGADNGFRFVLDYEGHTDARGAWSSPWLVISSAADPYEGLRVHRRRVLAGTASRGVSAAIGAGAPPVGEHPSGNSPAPARSPAWWRQPMFCGWGAQCALAAERGLSLAAAPGLARQTDYDAFLDALREQDIVPGTVVLDDKWQLAYATGKPDPSKWPDLRGWIADRHADGQRVVLWWKAWDPEGLDPDWTIRTREGRPIALDPDRPEARDVLAGAVRHVLDPAGLGADGLKIDFTARTPSGASLMPSGPTWGVGLLRRLLETIHDAAKEADPTAS